MKLIYKVELKLGVNTFMVGEVFRPLSVGAQYNKLVMWFEYDYLANADTTITVNVYHTGVVIPENPGRFLGTVILEDGQYILHVYSDR